jgi:hypothetical protein
MHEITSVTAEADSAFYRVQARGSSSVISLFLERGVFGFFQGGCSHGRGVSAGSDGARGLYLHYRPAMVHPAVFGVERT